MMIPVSGSRRDQGAVEVARNIHSGVKNAEDTKCY
jgi:hypothetical protein